MAMHKPSRSGLPCIDQKWCVRKPLTSAAMYRLHGGQHFPGLCQTRSAREPDVLVVGIVGALLVAIVAATRRARERTRRVAAVRCGVDGHRRQASAKVSSAWAVVSHV